MTRYSPQRHFHMLQHLEKIENLPESIQACFVKMKETTRNLNVEVGAFIAFYDSKPPEIVHFSSQNKLAISKLDIDKALKTILAKPNSEQIQKLVAVHTHPTDEEASPSHSNGDVNTNKLLRDFLKVALDRKINLESVVVPADIEFDEIFVFGKIVVTDKNPETRKIPIKAEISQSR